MLESLLAFVRINLRRGTVADDVNLTGVTFGLAFTGRNEYGFFSLDPLLAGVIVRLLTLPQLLQLREAFCDDGRSFRCQILRDFAGADRAQRGRATCGRLSPTLSAGSGFLTFLKRLQLGLLICFLVELPDVRNRLGGRAFPDPGDRGTRVGLEFDYLFLSHV